MKLTIVRDFAAPRALVYAAWTQSEHMKRWSAPHGFTVPVSEGDLRVDGVWRAVMVSPEGEKLALGGVYREIVPNELLVFTHSWEGEDGPETVVTVRFADIAGGATRLTFEQTGFDSGGARDGHRGGWEECFERLEKLLPTLEKGGANPARRRPGAKSLAARSKRAKR